jgi:hypothetical protein
MIVMSRCGYGIFLLTRFRQEGHVTTISPASGMQQLELWRGLTGSGDVEEYRLFRTEIIRSIHHGGAEGVFGRVLAIEAHLAALMAILTMLMARVGATHLTIAEAGALRKRLTGRGSVSSIRKLIARGRLTLEVIPGTRISGIPIEQIYPQWLPIAAARAALGRLRAERGSTTNA